MLPRLRRARFFMKSFALGSNSLGLLVMHRYPYELISTQNRIKFSSFVKLPERQPEIRNPVRVRGAKKQGI